MGIFEIMIHCKKPPERAVFGSHNYYYYVPAIHLIELVVNLALFEEPGSISKPVSYVLSIYKVYEVLSSSAVDVQYLLR